MADMIDTIGAQILEVFEENNYFKELASLYFNKNFGTATKSEIDLLMFKIYFREMEKINVSSCTDTKLAILLGISKQKVKLLREKMELKYPKAETEDLRKSAIMLLTRSFENKTEIEEMVYLSVPNIRLQYYIEDCLSSLEEPVHYERNSSVLGVSVNACALLLLELVPEEKKKEVYRLLENKTKSKNVQTESSKKGFWKNLDARTVFDFVSESLKFVNNIIGK